VAESEHSREDNPVPGTFQYTAPEYFLGEGGTPGSDLYSLGVVAYEMLTGRLPSGAELAGARGRARQRGIAYQSALDGDGAIPAWIDGVLKKAVHPDPRKRYEELSEFVHDLRHPGESLLSSAAAPLIERNPLLFWKGLSAVLAAALLASLLVRYF